MPAQTVIQHRRDLAADWTTANPVLSAGEIGFEVDTGKFKIGDGVLEWDELKYAGGGGGNLDGGEADTNYGGISPILGGNAELE
jgi:hypothetical protein